GMDLSGADLHGMDLSGANDPYRYLQTAVGPFKIPDEVASPRDVLNQWATLLELGVRNRYKPTEFLRLLKDHGIPTEQVARHRELFEQMVKLDAEGRNGIWARVIKNQFAPSLLEPVDIVVGNPPWVNWENLPKDYRDEQHPLWESYGLFSLSKAKGRLGGGKKDLSMLFVYACADRYLRPGGKLAFVITQTVFKTQGAGDGFRRLRFKGQDGKTAYLKPLVVDDMSDFQPFLDAANRTAVAVFEKSDQEFAYPVEYVQWTKHAGERLTQELDLHEVEGMMDRVEVAAAPIQVNESRSPWLTLPADLLEGARKVAGQSPYTAHAGSTTWLNGVFWLRVLEQLPNGLLLVENLWDVGKKHVEPVKMAIEPDLVYPLIRGRDVLRWKAEPSASLLLTQSPTTRAPLPTAEMKTKYPKTYDYLARFEAGLRQRSGYLKYYSGEGPFWALYNVGSYTLSPWKVGWPEVGTTVRAGVIAPAETGKTPIPDHKVVFVAVASGEEAYYLCGMLNSSLAQALIKGYVGISISTHIMNNINIPRFDAGNAAHVGLSKMASAIADMTEADRHEATSELDRLAGAVWGVGDDEAAVATAYAAKLVADEPVLDEEE
ncbi:MAG: SAM-dependent DNA methyltransferase, partial [Coriobacteriia bacterium]